MLSRVCTSPGAPSVTDESTCVSPRWNMAEPCTRGRRSTAIVSGRISVIFLPSRRCSLSRMRLVICSSTYNLIFLSPALCAASSIPFSTNRALAPASSASSIVWRSRRDNFGRSKIMSSTCAATYPLTVCRTCSSTVSATSGRSSASAGAACFTTPRSF